MTEMAWRILMHLHNHRERPILFSVDVPFIPTPPAGFDTRSCTHFACACIIVLLPQTRDRWMAWGHHFGYDDRTGLVECTHLCECVALSSSSSSPSSVPRVNDWIKPKAISRCVVPPNGVMLTIHHRHAYTALTCAHTHAHTYPRHQQRAQARTRDAA